MVYSGAKFERQKAVSKALILPNLVSFLLGCFLCTSILLLMTHGNFDDLAKYDSTVISAAVAAAAAGKTNKANGINSVLQEKRILVAIASFDFSQLPHLEEVLSSYRDICEAGATVDLYIYTTSAYPVALIDLLNNRLACTSNQFQIIISLKTPAVRLNLVNYHRNLFYEHLEQYDLFIYSEDDIRITPTTVAAYLYETEIVESIVGKPRSSDYNVGVVRYEYNFPPDVIIDDKTRHATKNVTRVYWEHPWKPSIPKSVAAVPAEPLGTDYVHMTNHHQGMYLATRYLLQKWRDRVGCNFDIIRSRPGEKNNPSQPTEGTQRVWMSSQMLYGSNHCNVQQVIPMDRFGSFNVFHLPNKNYRRVGKKGRLGGTEDSPLNEFADGKTKFAGPSSTLLTAMELHVEIEKNFPSEKRKYRKKISNGVIRMVDDEFDPIPYFKGKENHMEIIKRRMKAYNAYVLRGGIMSKEDMEGASQHLFLDEEEQV